MTVFMQALRSAGPGKGVWRKRRFVYVPYDQLSDRIGPLAREAPETLGIVLVESPWKASLRPYHRQKLATILANMRHFALEQAGRGVAVAYLAHGGPYRDALAPFIAKYGPVRMMEAAERELRVDLQPLVDAGGIEVLPHEGWLSTRADFDASHPNGPPYLMDRFYRFMRKRTGIMMERGGKPVGGRFSFDADNRKPWRGVPPAPVVPTFVPDAITREVEALILKRFPKHYGTLDLTLLPATREDAHTMFEWAMRECVEHFGPYEDAMSTHSPNLFHTRLSALLNIHRVLARDVIERVVATAAPLSSREGLVRQILGWREYMRHVHRATDGFRQPLPYPVPYLDDANHRLPAAYWGTPSGFNCLDTVVRDVWREGFGHHITRLMILSNIATLVGYSPRELTDWFWEAYVDAYDWVVEPNVMGMSTFGLGPLFTTKPYVSGAAYIDRMSDYCEGCAFDPKKNCPITPLYWAFMERNAEKLAANHRMVQALRTGATRDPRRKAEDRALLQHIRERWAAGEPVTPETVRDRLRSD